MMMMMKYAAQPRPLFHEKMKKDKEKKEQTKNEIINFVLFCFCFFHFNFILKKKNLFEEAKGGKLRDPCDWMTGFLAFFSNFLNDSFSFMLSRAGVQ
jgi:hypothetical protein